MEHMEADQESSFSEGSAEDLELLSSFEKINTQRGMKWILSKWKTWQTIQNAEADREVKMIPSLYGLMSLPVNEIDNLLAQFINELRTVGGKEFPIGSVNCIMFGIQRYARGYAAINKNEPLIFKGNCHSFPKLNKALRDKIVKLCKGIHCVTKKLANSISLIQEQALWDENILGLHSAKAMSNTIYFYVTKIFGFVSGRGLRVLKTNHFTFSSDEYGKFVELDVNFIKQFHDMVSYRCHGIQVLKTGQLRHYCDPTNPRTFYHLLQKYIQAMNKSLLTAGNSDNSLFLAPKEGMQFSNQPIGKNTLQSKLRSIMKAFNMNGHYQNHSLVQSIATRLQAKGYNIKTHQVYGPLDHLEICKILDPPPGLITTGEVQNQTKAILQLVSLPQGCVGSSQHTVPTASKNIPIFIARNIATPVQVDKQSTVVSSQMSVTQNHPSVDLVLTKDQKLEKMYRHRVNPVALTSGVTNNSEPLIQSATNSNINETDVKSNNHSFSNRIYNLGNKSHSKTLHTSGLVSPQVTHNDEAKCERNLEHVYPLSLSRINDTTEVDVNELLPHTVIKQEPPDSAEYENQSEPAYKLEQIQNETRQQHDNIKEFLTGKRKLDSDNCFTDIEISNKKANTDETEDASNIVDKHSNMAEIAYAFTNNIDRKSIKQEVYVTDNDQTLFSFSSTNKMGKTISDLDLNLGDFLPDDCVLKPGNINLKRVVTPDGGKLVIHVVYETALTSL